MSFLEVLAVNGSDGLGELVDIQESRDPAESPLVARGSWDCLAWLHFSISPLGRPPKKRETKCYRAKNILAM